MKKFLLATLISLLIGGQSICFAMSYPRVQYDHGFEGLPTEHLLGVLSVQTTGMTFNAQNGQNFTLPYGDIAGFRFDYKSPQQNAGPMAVMGPNPFLMIASLGVSALAYTAAKIHQREQCNYHYYLTYLDGLHKTHEIVFNLSSLASLKQLADDTESHFKEFQMMQRQKIASPPPQNHLPYMGEN